MGRKEDTDGCLCPYRARRVGALGGATQAEGIGVIALRGEVGQEVLRPEHIRHRHAVKLLYACEKIKRARRTGELHLPSLSDTSTVSALKSGTPSSTGHAPAPRRMERPVHEEQGWPALATLGGSRGPTGLQEGEEARERTHDLDRWSCSRGATKYNIRHSPSNFKYTVVAVSP